MFLPILLNTILDTHQVLSKYLAIFPLIYYWHRAHQKCISILNDQLVNICLMWSHAVGQGYIKSSVHRQELSRWLYASKHLGNMLTTSLRRKNGLSGFRGTLDSKCQMLSQHSKRDKV